MSFQVEHEPVSRFSLPLPPLALRQLVGATEESLYDNPEGRPLFGLAPETYDSVLDFGCGCGRIARQLIQQTPRPRRYLGLDLHRGQVEWCRANLAPHAPGFEFRHQNVFCKGLNPRGTEDVLPFPVPDQSVSLMLAWSVFTHVNEAAAAFYLRETARALRPGGLLFSTWFLFDKADFPMMQTFQNALFINEVDPTNAVIFDKEWLRSTAAAAGLTLERIVAPGIRGYQWQIWMTPRQEGSVDAEFPPDEAPRSSLPPPLIPAGGDRFGLEEPETRLERSEPA
jgi:SAM-dependent methyltransferase